MTNRTVLSFYYILINDHLFCYTICVTGRAMQIVYKQRNNTVTDTQGWAVDNKYYINYSTIMQQVKQTYISTLANNQLLSSHSLKINWEYTIQSK